MRISFSAAATALLLCACSTPPAPSSKPPAADVITTPAQPPAPQMPLTTPAQVPAVNASDSHNTQAPTLPDGITALLAHAERVRQLSPGDLAAEIAAQGDPGNVPLRQMQLALALMHMPQSVDTARALGLVQRVVGSPAPEATPLRPLARLLAHQLMEQRRLEDSVERQGQQLRDQQRRIDQLNDRLEAMRAIERSLTTRPPAAPNGTRLPAP